MSKTNRTEKSRKQNNIKVLEGALALVQGSLKGSQGGERFRLLVEEGGIRDALRRLGA